MITKNQTWINKATGEAVLILRVADIYVTYQTKAGAINSKHPMIFLQDFEEHKA
ncbi:hypothetical protein [uncultured Psychrobacter sp.]|uniref:hypothetical protein n=1 Tax=uncultured Psychrobacter sp. TaxID=259303 RepID=UPI00261FA3BB|nr:hypothetical protein [uncultured Psychrobacter sp.]